MACLTPFYGKLAKESNTMILSGNAADVAGMIATAMKVINKVRPAADKV